MGVCPAKIKFLAPSAPNMVGSPVAKEGQPPPPSQTPERQVCGQVGPAHASMPSNQI